MPVVKKGLMLVGGLLVILLAGLALSLAVDAWLGRDRLLAVTNTAVAHPGGLELRAYLARPEGEGPFPAVIMIHEFWGVNESLVSKARLLAQEGYVVLAPDTFRGRSTRWLPSAIYQTFSAPQARIDSDLDAAFAWLEAQAEVDATRIGVVGFCYGGRASLRYSLHNDAVAATVVFYGRPVTDPERLRALPAPVLGIFGAEDASIPLDEVRAFEAALAALGIPHEVSVYPDQGHAFVTSAAGIAAGGAQARAWAQMVEFLGGVLEP